MAEWDIGFEITALVRLDVRNPNDKMVFDIKYIDNYLYSNKILLGESLNRSQILSIFNTMAISGKGRIQIDESYPKVFHRLMQSWIRDKTIYELELFAKTKASFSWELDHTGHTDLVGHPPLTVAFVKLSEVKIINVGTFTSPIYDSFMILFDAS